MSQVSSRRHMSSSTSAHSGRVKASNTIIDHEHLSRIADMDEPGRRAVRADLDLNFDPWDPQISRWQQRLVMLALWKREVRRNQRYVPDYTDDKAASHRISHDGNIKVGMRAVKDFVNRSQNWNYEEGTRDLHDDFHKYHLRNYIPRVVGEYRKILNSPRMAAYTRCIPVDCYYEEILRDPPGFKPQALPRYRARSTSTNGKSAKATHHTSSHTLRNNSGWPEPSALCTWADEDLGIEKVKRYRMERLSLDELAEMDRLTELVRSIKDGNPPGFYSAMRDREVKGASLFYSAMRKEGRGYKPASGLIPAWVSGVKTSDFSTKTLRSAYDLHQIKSINARVIRITNTAIESDDEDISDGRAWRSRAPVSTT
jgi:hypothetical protein